MPAPRSRPAALLALVLALSMASSVEVAHLRFFYGEGCPHCAQEEPLLDRLEREYPSLIVHRYETWSNRTHAEWYRRTAAAYDANATGVPGTFIGEHLVIGYGSDLTTGRQIEGYVGECVERGCADPFARAGLLPAGPPANLAGREVCLEVFSNGTGESSARLAALLEALGRSHGIAIPLVDASGPEGALRFQRALASRPGASATLPAAFIGEKHLAGEDAIRGVLPALLERCGSEPCGCPPPSLPGSGALSEPAAAVDLLLVSLPLVAIVAWVAWSARSRSLSRAARRRRRAGGGGR